jgi:hypothetical protein
LWVRNPAANSVFGIPIYDLTLICEADGDHCLTVIAQKVVQSKKTRGKSRDQRDTPFSRAAVGTAGATVLAHTTAGMGPDPGFVLFF